MASRKLSCLGTVLFGLAFFLANASAQAAPYKIRWLLAHDPVKAFENAAIKFKQTVEKNTNGEVTVETMTLKEFSGKQELSQDEIYKRLQAGDYEMCQTFGTYLGSKSPKFWIFDLPYLFRNYEHAEHVIRGPLGGEILGALDSEGLKGLAITYSGGFRVIPTNNRKITKLEDFQGLRLRIPQFASVASAFYEKLGATPVPMSPETAASAQASNELDGLETTLPRFWELENRDASRTVNDTGHSLYVTALVVNKAFFEKLPEKYRKVVADAAREAADMERADAIKLGQDLKLELPKHGIQFVSLSEKERARLRKAAGAVYKDFEPVIGRDLIERVRATK